MERSAEDARHHLNEARRRMALMMRMTMEASPGTTALKAIFFISLNERDGDSGLCGWRRGLQIPDDLVCLQEGGKGEVFTRVTFGD